LIGCDTPPETYDPPVRAEEHRIAPDQWDQWVDRHDGHQLVVAGPGTGKTEFLVRRVSSIIRSGAASRDEVAVFSFSRRAAADLRRRVLDELDRPGAPIESSTFHSLALRLLELGTEVRPVPLTTPEHVGLVGRLLAQESPGDWPVAYRGVLDSPAFAAEVADFLMRCSERLLSPDDLEELTGLRADWKGIPGFFARYRDHLAGTDRIDYGTLLARAVEFLETPGGQELAASYRYVLVDEYQDTSPAQAMMADLLAGADGNLTVAGDPYQSVYSFRGAEVRNIASFEEQHPGCTRIVLDPSFRVPAEILQSALRVVSSGDLPGSAGPVQAAGHPGRVEAYVFDQETAEAEWIAREIEHAVRADGIAPSRIAVLVRSKREMLNELGRALTRRGLPHDPPGRRLVDHPSVQLVRDLVIAATVEPSAAADADRAMRRVLLGPLYSLSLGKERELARRHARTGERWSETVRSTGELDDLSHLLQETAWATSQSATEGFWNLWIGLEAFARVAHSPEKAPWRLALASFAQALDRQAERDSSVTLAGYFALTDEDDFEATPLISPTPLTGRIALTTLHQAKGLEFDIVFIANAVEGVFPDLRRSRRMLRPELLSRERTSDAGAQHIFQVQEEMRLAYTAMTRARLRVVWTATDAGVDQGEHRPSRFLLAAAGVKGSDELGVPVEGHREPVTPGEFEVGLRRNLADPEASAPARLAAARVLADAPGGWWDPWRFAGVAEPGPDRPVLPPVIRLSPSQADAYQSCPRRFVLERRLRLGADSSPYATFGSLVHSVLELAEKAVIGTDARHADLADALDLLDSVWEEKADFGTPALDEAWKKRAIEGITKLYERWPGTGLPIAVETMVEHEIEGVLWVGVIDRLERVEDGLMVIDYKTGGTAMTLPDAAVSVQLAFYADAVERSHGEQVAGAEMWFPRTNAMSVTVRHLDMARRDEVNGIMAGVTASILDEDWTPRVHAYCGRCEFRNSCPAWPEGRGAYLA
jgi:superfamily I DNA/RNA helicase/RecB family exonuclease